MARTDVGLEYVQKIGFKRRDGINPVKAGLKEIYDKKIVTKLCKELEKIDDGSPEFYEFKNRNIEISSVISECFDTEIIRNFCNYLYQYKDFIKGEVLDVGCESGYMTGFLASYFPNVHITSIDRSENAVNVARERVERLGVTNVDFKVASVSDIEGTFDTVISMRTLMENIATDIINNDIFQGADFDYQFAANRKECVSYAACLANHVKDGGHLISIERLPLSPLEYGWMSALNDAGCGYIRNTFCHINCDESDTTGRFTAFVAKNGTKTSDDKIRRFVIDEFLEVNDDLSGWVTKTACKGWTAVAYFLENKGECVVDNFIIEDDANFHGPTGRFAVYIDKNDPSKMLYLVFVVGYQNAWLDVLDSSLRDRAAAEVEMRTKMEERSGLKRASNLTFPQ